MKNLTRNSSGKLIVTSAEPAVFPGILAVVDENEEELSPIVTKTNYPKQLQAKPVEKLPGLCLFTEELLLEEMKKAGGKNLETEQFALLLAPKIKASQDAIGHHNWDLARGKILKLMRDLEKKGLVTIVRSSMSGKFHYLFSLKE